MAIDGKRRNKPKGTKKPQNPKNPKGGSKVGK